MQYGQNSIKLLVLIIGSDCSNHTKKQQSGKLKAKKKGV